MKISKFSSHEIGNNVLFAQSLSAWKFQLIFYPEYLSCVLRVKNFNPEQQIQVQCKLEYFAKISTTPLQSSPTLPLQNQPYHSRIDNQPFRTFSNGRRHFNMRHPFLNCLRRHTEPILYHYSLVSICLFLRWLLLPIGWQQLSFWCLERRNIATEKEQSYFVTELFLARKNESIRKSRGSKWK